MFKVPFGLEFSKFRSPSKILPTTSVLCRNLILAGKKVKKKEKKTLLFLVEKRF